MPFLRELLDDLFSSEPTFGEDQLHQQAIRSAARVYAEVIVNHTPPCADQTRAVSYLRQSVMWANSAIALKGKS
jgi:hypothetical protein